VRLKTLETEREHDTNELHRRHLLHEALSECFSDEELNRFMYGLGVDYETVEGDTKKEKSFQFVLYMQRHGRFIDLIKAAMVARPHIDWLSFR